VQQWAAWVIAETAIVDATRAESCWFLRGIGFAIAQRMENKPYDIRERSYLFARDVVAFCRVVSRGDRILRRLATQLVDAAGSVGANLEEAADGQSKPDFINKNCIALKECREAKYWLRLIGDSEPPLKPEAMPLIREADELKRIVRTIVVRAKEKHNDRGDSID
jgi:four helix bundle protein